MANENNVKLVSKSNVNKEQTAKKESDTKKTVVNKNKNNNKNNTKTQKPTADKPVNKTFNQKLACDTFDCLYEEFKDDPEYSKVILPLKRYVDFINNSSIVKNEDSYVKHNYDLYTSMRILLSQKDSAKVANYLKIINKAFVVASDVFSSLHLLAYDYRWNGSDATRREWLALATLLVELANPLKRREMLKIIDFNEGLKDISPVIADNLRKFYVEK